MEDYAHRPAVPAASEAAPVFKTHRSVGFRYIIPLGLLVGFGLFLVSYVFRLMGGPWSPRLTTTVRPTDAPARTKETTSPTVAVSPTPAGKTVPILVMNGSGRAGVAGKLQEELEKLGYTAVRTGNAETFSYTDLTIHATGDNRSAAEALKRLLEKTHTVHDIATDASAGADLIVIVGKE